MIKAIIFDCFGVLASDGWLPYKARYFADNPELEIEVTLLNKDADAGKISYDTFVDKVAQLANLPEKTARQQIENNIPDEKLFAYIRTLKPKFKVGMLSNASDNWLDKIFTEEQVALFDQISLSCDTGVIKPDADAYKLILQKLGINPDEAVFVDDQPKYVDGAKQVGLHTILYANFEQCKQDLEKLVAF